MVWMADLVATIMLVAAALMRAKDGSIVRTEELLMSLTVYKSIPLALLLPMPIISSIKRLLVLIEGLAEAAMLRIVLPLLFPTSTLAK